jgi:cobyric acid synthase
MILEPAISSVEKITRKRNFGVIPKLEVNLPAEDSLDSTSGVETPYEDWDKEIDLLANSIKNKISLDVIMSEILCLDKP